MTRHLRIACSITLVFFASLATASRAAGQSTSAQSADDCSELPGLKKRLTVEESRLHDWAQLGRYADANTKVAPPAKGEDRVVFMGDSITDIWHLQEAFPGKPYINRGIGGQTTPQMLIRFRPEVVELNPKVVVILAGTNDLSGNTGPETLQMIEDNLSSMAELARVHRIRVVMASLLPVSNYGHNREGKPVDMRVSRPPEKILALNQWIKQYCAENGFVYLDYFSALVDDSGLLKSDMSNDGLHPNAKGFAVMAPLAQKAIGEALKKR